MTLDELLPVLFTTENGLTHGTLTGPQTKPDRDDALRRVDISPLTLKGKPVFQFAYRAAKKITHRNLSPEEATAHAQSLLVETFTQAQFQTADGTACHLTRTKNGHWSIKRKTPLAAAPLPSEPVAHNRRKNYLLPDGEPVPFLIRLGVMTTDGRVVTARYDKFRQINRFLELVADTLNALDTTRPLRIIDFGAGKAYLTFALYHLLHVQRDLDVQITGLDLKADVVAHCNEIAQDLGYAGRLRFVVGDIAGYSNAANNADMVVSLHACDTATDDALARAVAWNTSVILSVPCCQHELFRKIDNDMMRPLLKHGILKERMAALITDALRAEMLESHGYSVQVLEFIELEHTPKNLLLRAVRRRTPNPAHERRIRNDYRAFRDAWQIKAPHIETVFPEDGSAPPD